MKPIVVDLCCGLGGWTEGFIDEGWDAIGFDIERHVYGEHRYPAQLVLQDICTLTGAQFKGQINLIVASPPCQRYSYMAMPWTKSKQLIAWHRDPAHPERTTELNALFDACVRIAREAQCPIVIENVRGAQPWVGRSRWNFGSYHLWGDVPALMPMTQKVAKVLGFRVDGSGTDRVTIRATHVKVPNQLHIRQGHVTSTPHLTNAAEHIKQGGDWFAEKGSISRTTSSQSSKRKFASAMIAKIPLALSRHIARTFYPR